MGEVSAPSDPYAAGEEESRRMQEGKSGELYIYIYNFLLFLLSYSREAHEAAKEYKVERG